MIRTPCLPPFFTSRLCSPIHRLTSLLTCQLALSHTNTRTFLPAATSFSDNHERKRVVTPLTGRPSTIYKPKPPLLELRHEESVAGDGLRVRVVFGERLLHEARGLAILAPGVHRWQGKARLHHVSSSKPTAQSPGCSPPSASGGRGAFFSCVNSGSGLVIQRLARSQRTPILSRLARTVSALTRSSVIPSSKLTSAARSKVHRLVSLPNSLGLR